MPSYTISLSPYFDKIGPFDRPLTRMVLQSTDEIVSPPPALTVEPGEQWLGLIMAMLGGRSVALFGQAGGLEPLAAGAKSTGHIVSAVGRWMRDVRRVYRYQDPGQYQRTAFHLWTIPAPYPPGMATIIEDIERMLTYEDPLLMVNETGMTFLDYIDPLWDMGAMYWRLFPGHLRLQLDTRFVGPRELERHILGAAKMAGVELWPMKV
jgi:hypothetical protein